MFHRYFVGAALASSLLALTAAASAQDKMVIKASDVHPPGYPNIVAMENMGKKLEKETNGRLTMQMYHSMQLGGEKEMIEQAQVGALQIARVSVGPIGNAHFVRFLEFLGHLFIPRQSIRLELASPAEQRAYLARVQREHHRMFGAISARDPAEARRAMREHLSRSLERYRTLAERRAEAVAAK